MGVYIKDFEMPKNCFICPFKNLEICDEDCPLIEVPPHGRLIDADALEDSLGIEDVDIYAYHIINDSPTVIEREE